MWFVRAGKKGVLLEAFLDESLISIGWDIGDLTQYNNEESILKAIEKKWPEKSRKWHKVSARTVYKFYKDFKVGDRILTYDPKRRVYHSGTIKGDYQYGELDDRFPSDHHHYRKVAWDAETFSRDQLSVSARNSLGSLLTIFKVPEPVIREISNLPIKEGENTLSQENDGEERTEWDLESVENRSLELIKDVISRIDWDDMQHLVAGLLRAVGYKTVVSPYGSDRGKDIIASPDGFGFESPRIVVEVKHRPSQAIGSQEIRSFIGGRHEHDKGLFVSTGGFTRDAYYEAERSKIPLTLMTLDELVQALLDNYENLDLETKKLLPLKAIYWPITE